MNLRLLLTALAVALSASCATAPSTPSAAQDILTSQHVGDLFTAAPGTPDVTLSHNRSRLVCHFDPKLPLHILVYEHRPRGDDVSCGQNHGADVVTLYATRYQPPLSLKAAIDESVQEIMSVSPQAQLSPALAAANPLAAFPSETRTFVIPHFNNGRDTVFSRTSVAVIDGWVYVMRFSTPDRDQGPARAERAWDRFATDLVSARGE